MVTGRLASVEVIGEVEIELRIETADDVYSSVVIELGGVDEVWAAYEYWSALREHGEQIESEIEAQVESYFADVDEN
jgi:hypothetical protein